MEGPSLGPRAWPASVGKHPKADYCWCDSAFGCDRKAVRFFQLRGSDVKAGFCETHCPAGFCETHCPAWDNPGRNWDGHWEQVTREEFLVFSVLDT